MTLRAGEKIREGNFIKNSERDLGTPLNDADKVPRLENNGLIHHRFVEQPTVDVTAETDIVIGQPVGFSMNMNDKVAKAFEDILSASVGTVGTIYGAQGIGDNAFIVNYKLLNSTFNNAFYVTLITLDPATNALTVRNTLTLYSVGNHEFDSAQPVVIQTNRALVTVYENVNSSTSHNTQVHIIALSGTTISRLGGATLQSAGSGAAGVRTVSTIMLSATQGVWGGWNTTAAQRQIVPFTISGSTVTVGTSFNDVDISAGSNLIKVTATKVAHMTSGGALKIMTIAANAVASNALSASLLTSYGVAKQATGAYIADDEILISKPISQFVVSVRRVTVSGNTPTGGNSFNITTTDDFSIATKPNQMITKSTYAILLSGLNVYKVTVSGVNISYAPLLHRFYAQGGDNILLGMGDSLFFLISWVGSQFYCIREGMAWNLAGIAQATVSRGAALKVIVSGADYNQSGLSQGATYIPYQGAFIPDTPPSPKYYSVRAIGTNAVII